MHYLVEISIEKFNLPLNFSKFLKLQIDYSLEYRWDIYLSVFYYLKKFFLLCVLNFLFGYGSPFGFQEYYKWATLIIKIIDIMISLIFVIISSSLSILSNISLLLIIFLYEALIFLICLSTNFLKEIWISMKYVCFQILYCFLYIKKIFFKRYSEKLDVNIDYKQDPSNAYITRKKKWFLFLFKKRAVFFDLFFKSNDKKMIIDGRDIVNYKGIIYSFLYILYKDNCFFNIF